MTDPRDLLQLIEVPAAARRLYPRGELYGLEPAQLQVLVALVLAAAEDTSRLVEVLAMNRSTVSHAVAVLEKRGLVQRAAVPDDHRRTYMRATESGRLLVSEFATARGVTG